MIIFKEKGFKEKGLIYFRSKRPGYASVKMAWYMLQHIFWLKINKIIIFKENGVIYFRSKRPGYASVKMARYMLQHIFWLKINKIIIFKENGVIYFRSKHPGYASVKMARYSSLNKTSRKHYSSRTPSNSGLSG